MRIVRASRNNCKCFLMQRKIVQGKTSRTRPIFREFDLKFWRPSRRAHSRSGDFAPQTTLYLDVAAAVYADLSPVFLQS